MPRPSCGGRWNRRALRLLTQFTTIPDGMKFLVDLRAELLRGDGRRPVLAALENDLRGLLASWFDVGFLELRRIDWNARRRCSKSW